MANRRKIQLYLDSEVFEKFRDSIKDTGLSASRVIEMVMRVSTSKSRPAVEDVFEAVWNVVKEHERKKKK